MDKYTDKRGTRLSRRILSGFIAFNFLFFCVFPPQFGCAAALLDLPAPGMMVATSAGFIPAVIKGLTIDPKNPLRFDFIVDTGDSGLEGARLEAEATRLIKYFLASLTVPEDDLWVNLSPYEQDRIIPEGFGTTEMGRDLLSQDYMLKQLTATLMYPEEDLGREFWQRVYNKARDLYGTTEIPVNTFNKIWIVPQDAVVYEQETSAFVVRSRLKVMLEEDYLTLRHNLGNKVLGTDRIAEGDVRTLSGVSSGIVKEVLLPEIEREVNEGQNFAGLRQIYNAMILATWFKRTLKNSLLGQVYVDKNRTRGVDVADKEIKEKIYTQYLEAFKKGVYNYIREDYDPALQQPIPRRYFSGGFKYLPEEIRVVKGDLSSSPVATRRMVRSGLNPSGPAARNVRFAVDLVENVAEDGAEQLVSLSSPATNEAEIIMLRSKMATLDEAEGIALENLARQKQDAVSQEDKQEFEEREKHFRKNIEAKRRRLQGEIGRLTQQLMGAGEKQEPSSSPAVRAGNRLLLSVDNDAKREKLKELFTKRGYEVVLVETPWFIEYDYLAVSSEVEPVQYIVASYGLDQARTGYGNVEDLLEQIEEIYFSGAPLRIPVVILLEEGENIDEKRIRDRFNNVKTVIWQDRDGLSDSEVVEMADNVLSFSSPVTILVVDDDEGLAKLTVEALEMWGFEVVQAGNPQEARERIKEMKDAGRAPDVILSDLQMPEQRGDDFAVEIEQELPGVSVFIRTGTTEIAEPTEKIQGKTPVIKRVFRKPAQMKEILAAIREVLPEPESSSWDTEVSSPAEGVKQELPLGREAIEAEIGASQARLQELQETALKTGTGDARIRREQNWLETLEAALEKITAEEGAESKGPSSSPVTDAMPDLAAKTPESLRYAEERFLERRDEMVARIAEMEGENAEKRRQQEEFPHLARIYAAGIETNEKKISSAKQQLNGVDENLNQIREELQRKETSSPVTSDEKVGGIDLNPALLDLQIRRDANGVPLPLPQQPIQEMNIEGFFPVIINVTPVPNLPALLGLAEEGAELELSGL